MKRLVPKIRIQFAAPGHADSVRRHDLSAGDLVFVRTHNSTYTLRRLVNGDYLVAGGWFERRNMSPIRLAVAGCTWGGTAIKQDLVAARGMCLEFGNRLVTSVIRHVRVLHHWSQN